MGNCFSNSISRAPEADAGSVTHDKFPSVEIHNDTEKTIALRDRDREVYGALRYKIPSKATKKVEMDLRDAGTYYRMAVLVMVDENDDNRVEPTHPPLFIDTEDLSIQKKITISCKGGKHFLDRASRGNNFGKNSAGDGSSKREPERKEH